MKTFKLCFVIALSCAVLNYTNGKELKTTDNSDLKVEKNKLQSHIEELNKISNQYNQSKDKNRIEKLISNIEIFTGRKMSLIEKKFMKAQFSQMDSMPLAEISKNEILFYDESDSKRENLLKMQIIDAEKNLFKYNNIVFELNPYSSIQENLKEIINGLNASAK